MKTDIYKKYEPYLTYTKNINEKKKLQEYIANEFKLGNLLITTEKTGQRILDVGCGNGVNTLFLAKLFKQHYITGVDSSPAQIKFAKEKHNASNIDYYCLPFEKLETPHKFDFILASHTLQYISSKPVHFIKKIIRLLNENSEAWIVQHTKKGLYEIIQHQKPFLKNPLFANWLTFEDYLPLTKQLSTENKKGLIIQTQYLQTSIKSINFANPTDEDKQRLEFIFGLEKSFDKQSSLFKKHLAKLSLGSNGRISHPNGIIKIKKRLYEN